MKKRNKSHTRLVFEGRMGTFRVYLPAIVFLTLILSFFFLSASTKNLSDMDGHLIVSKTTVPRHRLWSELEILHAMEHHPNRATFLQLFLEGGFQRGVEIGVAAGRFSEHFMRQSSLINGFHWTLIEPSPLPDLLSRLSHNCSNSLSWTCQGVSAACFTLINGKSLSQHTVSRINLSDFIYLDGLHTYDTVLKEMHVYWRKVRPGGVMAGHDYCSYNKTISERCGVYTELTSRRGTPVASQDEVVRAANDWLQFHPSLRMHTTKESFTRESLQTQGYDYDLVLTKTRNPSWFVYKPMTYCGAGQVHMGGIQQNPICARKLKNRCTASTHDLTVAILYYNEPQQLMERLTYYETSWTDTQIKRVRIVVIDDGSPIAALDAIANMTQMSIGLCIAVIHEDISWNIGGARNLAMYVAPTEWVLMTDIDTTITSALLQFVLDSCDHHPASVFIDFPRTIDGTHGRPHPAVMLIQATNFWLVGGNDEDFVGHYGFTDVHFKHRLRELSVEVTSLSGNSSVPPLLGVHVRNVKTRTRHTRFNSNLFTQKVKGFIPWSDDALRFDWTIHDAPKL
ncbi:MAG: hypothetical protein J3K34DRAFT_447751 [Monoraphidium minutum]|nr:MAG: hypothetical protein J3K34DRAFT_447751 [Monoraphidium minutum]